MLRVLPRPVAAGEDDAAPAGLVSAPAKTSERSVSYEARIRLTTSALTPDSDGFTADDLSMHGSNCEAALYA